MSQRGNRGLVRWVGIGSLLLSGLIHLSLAPEHFEEAAYLGTLFALFFLSTVVSSYGIYRGRRWGWWLGVAIVVVAVVAYVLHGTVGLPVVGVEEPFEPIAVVDKLAELVFLGAAAVALSDRRAAARASTAVR